MRVILLDLTITLPHLLRDWRTSQKTADNTSSVSDSTERNILKQLLPVQNIGSESFPHTRSFNPPSPLQMEIFRKSGWLIDWSGTISSLELLPMAPRSSLDCRPSLGRSSLFLFAPSYLTRPSLSNQTFQPTKNAVDLIDAKGSSYTWRIFERIEEKKPTNDTRTGSVFLALFSELMSPQEDHPIQRRAECPESQLHRVVNPSE